MTAAKAKGKQYKVQTITFNIFKMSDPVSLDSGWHVHSIINSVPPNAAKPQGELVVLLESDDEVIPTDAYYNNLMKCLADHKRKNGGTS